jgi:hypothetical protein
MQTETADTDASIRANKKVIKKFDEMHQIRITCTIPI